MRVKGENFFQLAVLEKLRNKQVEDETKKAKDPIDLYPPYEIR